MVADDYLAD
jgi:hypothetical protein